MIPTLLVGDYLFVSKYAYGYSRYSLPFGLPLISGRILAAEPERGDVVVFKLPSDNNTDYIKRIIGLPGDDIQLSTASSTSTARPSSASPSAVFAAGTATAPAGGSSAIARRCPTGSAIRSWR